MRRPAHTTGGQDVYFKFVVTNSGDVALNDVTLTDNVFDLSAARPSPTRCRWTRCMPATMVPWRPFPDNTRTGPV